ncbi:helix-turn-helix domain-containing protein [Arthrobacter sp. VKM Ac-2550]|uniref:helix-turn-helix domain-containing protein n=1 Tax=Crystallibacter permensis TaxID=1938888 RepID=UPI002225DD96|nr:PucR family transcriptional regulator [Arthrobacter sp. VKM Ac-2550]MCW2134363.1 PucR C-terminal helix-turn-helix domain-containing protein [Arthrobacter sp. VKM Ac-2550]
MDAQPALSLSDVVGQDGLGLQAVVPGDPNAVVIGAHTSEIHDPAKWFEPETVMLTTGLRFVGAESDSALADKLVAELKSAKVAALFFGVGVYFREVPRTLTAACKRANFPLYTVAAEVPFHHIENFINQSKISPDSYVLKRAMRLTNDLLQSVSAENPVQALIARLGSVCRGTAVLYEDSGRIIESTGEGPTHLIWNELRDQKQVSDRISIGRWEVMARPLVLRGNGYWLAIASRNTGVIDELGEMLLETTQRLLGAINGISQFSVSKERHENAQLLSMLQDGIPVAREYRHWERMRPFRFVPYERVRAVAAANLEQEPIPAPLVERLLQRASVSGLGLLLAENGRTPESPPGFHALVSDTAALEAWLGLAEDVFIGLSEPYSDLATTPDAFREAETAAGIAGRRARAAGANGSGGRWIVRLDEVDPATWLLARRQSPQDSDKLGKFVQGLDRDTELRQTVLWYLARNLDIAQVAKVLFVHPNTVRYRLKKAEDLIGGPLSSSRIIANLYLAYHEDILALEETDLV